MTMVIVVVIGALIPSVTILGCVLWGWAHDTLRETAQDRFDWDFETITARLRG